MRVRSTFVTAAIAIVAIVILGECSQSQKVGSLGVGTWINEKMTPQRMVVAPDGSWKMYAKTSDTNPVPAYEGTTKGISQWTDSDGNIWQKAISTTYDGAKYALLIRFSKSGTVEESDWVEPTNEAEQKNPVYPKIIDPKSPNYQIWYKATQEVVPLTGDQPTVWRSPPTSLVVGAEHPWRVGRCGEPPRISESAPPISMRTGTTNGQ